MANKGKCLVCSRQDRAQVDVALMMPARAVRQVALDFGIARNTLVRHKRDHVLPRASPKIANALAKVRDDQAELVGHMVGSELTRLYEHARELGAKAEVTGDLRTALVAIRELTRIYELQVRLTLDANQARVHDVAGHPAWHKLAAVLTHALAPWPDAARAVEQAIREALDAP